MKKTLHYLLASLLCAMTLGANAQTALVDYPTSMDGITTAGTSTTGTVKIHTNKDAVSCLILANGYTSNGIMNGNHIELAIEGGFKTGDQVIIAGVINSGDASKRATAVLFTTEDGENATKLYQFEDFIDSKVVADDPVEQVYTLESDYDVLYIGRDGGTKANITLLQVVRPADASKEDVTMSFPEESYSVMEGTEFESPVLTVDPAVSPILYDSSDESVATVDENGAVTILGQGQTVITASFAGDDTYNAATARYTLTVTEFIDGALLIDYPTSMDGISTSGTSTAGTVKIHTNTDAVSCLILANGYTTDGVMNGNHIELNIEGGFKAGDQVIIAGVINSGDASKRATAVLFTSEDGSSVEKLYQFEDFIDSKVVADDPERQVYTLESDYDVLYLGRDGGTKANLILIRVIRPTEEPATVAVTISESTYATFYYETQAFEIPDGVTASAVVREGSSLTEIPVEGVIPAGCPVLLHGEAGEYEFVETMEEGVTPSANSLIGSEEGGTYNEEGYKYYVLSYKNKNKLPEEVGFYFLSGSKGAYAKVKAHQAYMRVTTTQANEAGYSLFETTGISTVETAATESDAPMYNLAGQRVNGSYRGVVIQNGVKKVNK